MLKDNPEQKEIVKTVKKFGQRGAYVYLPCTWVGKNVAISLYHRHRRHRNNHGHGKGTSQS
jgi:hypothetical protein